MRTKLVRYPRLKPDYDIPFSRVHLKRKVDAGTFPAPIHLGENTIAWLEDDILDWKARLLAERDAKHRPAAEPTSDPAEHSLHHPRARKSIARREGERDRNSLAEPAGNAIVVPSGTDDREEAVDARPAA
jgi:hypothetical protein